MNLKFEVLPGEGAFYGPKIELHLSDCLRSVLGSAELFSLIFLCQIGWGASFVNADSDRETQLCCIELF